MTMLGLPQFPPRPQGTGPVRFTDGHHFVSDPDADIGRIAEEVMAPLSVIVQVTKRCDSDCNFCSETLQLPDPSLQELESAAANLAGVRRVFLSGVSCYCDVTWSTSSDCSPTSSSDCSPTPVEVGGDLVDMFVRADAKERYGVDLG
ncbi:hypothetical protein ACFOY4_01135 [Actinomadura syzygii]|uniref:Radical SAM protein n=1 Tax=Actinomadura syzygii TaxID=1427538 RepID=A0A5D0TQQ6_9ACTN|nr:hypothetical protein [Actinomadura syzygii]TYC08641.1 hypothetical protein FXF65_37780 [Actinomadura syzygii]